MKNPRFPRSTEKNEYRLIVKLFKKIMQSYKKFKNGFQSIFEQNAIFTKKIKFSIEVSKNGQK